MKFSCWYEMKYIAFEIEAEDEDEAREKAREAINSIGSDDVKLGDWDYNDFWAEEEG